jgi:peptide/nickel transport system permease protein
MRSVRLLASGLLSVWLAVTVAFFALRLLPGDALQAELTLSGASQDVVEARRTAAGLTESVIVQYGRYLLGLARGDLGDSLVSGESVADALRRSLPPTLNLALGAGMIAAALGVSLGIVSALRIRGLSAVARVITSLSLSVPIYWSGIIAIYVFGVALALLPASGAGSAAHLVLPVGLLGFHTAGAVARVTQASVASAARADFVRTARAKGLPQHHIMRQHVLRVGLLPVVSILALQIGFLLGGTVVTESMFVRPGIGRLLLDAVVKQDYPIVQGVVLLSAAAYVLVNTAANLLYTVLDPRVLSR